MTRTGLAYTLAAAIVAMFVALAGGRIAGPPNGAAVGLGAGLGFIVQLVIFWVFFVWTLPGSWAIAHGMGAIVRMMAVALVAFGVGPLTGMSVAPVLFSLVACLFACTLLEPIILNRHQPAGRPRGVATIRIES